MISYSYVDEFIHQWREGKIVLNEDRILLIEWLERDILSRNDIYFDGEQIENFITFTEKYYFPLQLFQKFLTCFIFLFYDNGELVFDEHLHYMARGAGKNGLLSSLGNYLISELHGVYLYHISVIANSEEQAKTSHGEIYNTIELNKKLKKHFRNTKSMIESKVTKSIFKFRTSNADSKDGGREGAVFFDEVHRYEDSTIVDVFKSGLGKVKWPRVFYVTTDGYVRDGYMDKLKERARNILKGNVSVEDDGLFPWLCCLDDEEEMHDPKMWQKANPMFHPPMCDYAKNLYRTVMKHYTNLENDPSGYEEFVTKRMNLPKVDLEKSVTSWEKIKATNQEYDLEELKKYPCIGSLDYASVRDFVACGLTFKQYDKYYFPRELTHSFVCKPFADKHYAYSRKKSVGNNKKENRKFAPIREWEEEGLLTIVDMETMDPHIVVEWFVRKRKEGWNIKKIVGDNYKMDVLKPLFEAEGFEVEIIRNPDAASGLLAPRIEIAFEQENIIFGDNPLMRWYTNNVLVKILPNGNKVYRKKEEVKRKTDGFMAFVYGMWEARLLEDVVDVDVALDILNALDF